MNTEPANNLPSQDTDDERTQFNAAPGYAAPAIPSRAHCEERLRAYMEKHGHEGTATRAEKEEAFKREYWDFNRRRAVPHSVGFCDRPGESK